MAGDRERSDDQLAHTATAPGSDQGTPPSDAPPARGELGRYRLQRELGRGGMGVVHAAFDPDLERRVALKVLRATGSTEARQRLLREARAMARVAHSNVVSVHEVGSADGRDYIAMELVDGATLEDWLAESPRTEREVVDAFIAAGRGLAAAHAAGLVHRDFKPRNVLRHKDGRIVVTDFGLVVGVTTDDALAETLSATPDGPPLRDTPSSLSGLTATGSLLGTPAYMAPEQWADGTVGPPADQFAFCVALWEALAHERPYRGTTHDELKTEVSTGKRADPAKLPRRFRKLLVRGLDPDPAKRWPSMDALLAALTRAQRRPGVAIVLGGGALVAAGIIVLLVNRGHAGATCGLPVIDPARVWGPHDGEMLRANHQRLAADAIDRDMRAWLQIRARACTAVPGAREPQLACLDGVLSRIDAYKAAVIANKTDNSIDITGGLIDPKVCESARPPRLVTIATPELREIVARTMHQRATRVPLSEAEADEMTFRAKADPCASALAHLLAASYRGGTPKERELDEAERAAQRCADDRIIANIAEIEAEYAINLEQPTARAKLKSAEAAIERVSQPDLVAEIEGLHAELLSASEKMDEAIELGNHAVTLFDQRHRIRASIDVRLKTARLVELRGRPADLQSLAATFDEIRQRSADALGDNDDLVRQVDLERALWMWARGDVIAGDALREKIMKPAPFDKVQIVRGQVVDLDGHPVPSAIVTVGTSLTGDSLHAAVPDDYTRTTRTGDDGWFEIKDGPENGVAIAQLADRRSQPQRASDHTKLVLEPTSRISGKVELNGRAPELVEVVINDKRVPIDLQATLQAPVQRDGSYSVDGVPRAEVHIQTAAQELTSSLVAGRDLVVNAPVMAGVALEVKRGDRRIFLLVRSQYGDPLPLGQVFVVPGKRASTNVREMLANLTDVSAKWALPLQIEDDSPAIHAKSKPGDLFAQVNHMPPGELTACGVPAPEHYDDPDFQARMNKPENLEKIPVICVPVPPDDNVVVISTTPFPRLE